MKEDKTKVSSERPRQISRFEENILKMGHD